MVQDEQEKWDIVIKPRSGLFRLDLEEVWLYRDLLVMYIRRDIVTFYKQTVLGPLWFVIQPLLTTVMFMFVFGGIAGIPTDGLPQPLFRFTDKNRVVLGTPTQNLQDTPYLFVTADDGIQFAAAGCFVQIDGILFQ